MEVVDEMFRRVSTILVSKKCSVSCFFGGPLRMSLYFVCGLLFSCVLCVCVCVFVGCLMFSDNVLFVS